MPDGNSILFHDWTGPSALGSALKIVELNSLKVSAISEAKDLFLPAVSPDGRYVASAAVDGQKLMLMELRTRNWSELLKMNVGSISWSPDSKYVYFDTGLSKDAAFFRLRIADRKLERVADLRGLRRVVFAGFPWSGITPDGAPLLLRDTSSQEVYALDFEAP